MPIISVRIPQMGEGLQEARLVQYLKKPGDVIRRDEPIYVMETDKAITEVESPCAGRLVSWLAEPDTVLPIGAEIAQMEVDSDVPAQQAAGHHPAGAPSVAPTATAAHHSATARNGGTGNGNGGIVRAGNLGVPIPPRTRKYLREKGLLQQASQIPAAGKKLLPDDIDRYLADAVTTVPSTSAPSSVASTDAYSDRPLPKTQQTLNFRMQRGADACIPAVIEMPVEWSAIADAREHTRNTTRETGFSMLVWCIVQAMRDHALLRSSISADGKNLRTYRHINIGVAVAVEDGLLRTAVVRDADTLNRESFANSLVAQIEKVRRGEDQIDATTTVTVSNIGASGVRMGVPVVVTPAVATIALGQVYQFPFPLPEGNGFQFRPVATMTMTFDHRVLNGVAAAEFLSDVRRLAEGFSL